MDFFNRIDPKPPLASLGSGHSRLTDRRLRARPLRARGHARCAPSTPQEIRGTRERIRHQRAPFPTQLPVSPAAPRQQLFRYSLARLFSLGFLFDKVDVRRRQLRTVSLNVQPTYLARERERHLVVAVIHPRAGIGPDIEGLVPPQMPVAPLSVFRWARCAPLTCRRGACSLAAAIVDAARKDRDHALVKGQRKYLYRAMDKGTKPATPSIFCSLPRAILRPHEAAPVN